MLDWDRGAALTAVKQLKQVCKAQALTDRGETIWSICDNSLDTDVHLG